MHSPRGCVSILRAQLLADDLKNLFNECWDSLGGLRRQSISKCWGFLEDGRFIDIVPNRQDYGFTIGDLASREPIKLLLRPLFTEKIRTDNNDPVVAAGKPVVYLAPKSVT